MQRGLPRVGGLGERSAQLDEECDHLRVAARDGAVEPGVALGERFEAEVAAVVLEPGHDLVVAVLRRDVERCEACLVGGVDLGEVRERARLPRDVPGRKKSHTHTLFTSVAQFDSQLTVSTSAARWVTP